jgi:hypothetical protein
MRLVSWGTAGRLEWRAQTQRDTQQLCSAYPHTHQARSEMQVSAHQVRTEREFTRRLSSAVCQGQAPTRLATRDRLSSPCRRSTHTRHAVAGAILAPRHTDHSITVDSEAQLAALGKPHARHPCDCRDTVPHARVVFGKQQHRISMAQVDHNTSSHREWCLLTSSKLMPSNIGSESKAAGSPPAATCLLNASDTAACADRTMVAAVRLGRVCCVCGGWDQLQMHN